MKNTPWKIDSRESCRAIVDSAGNDIVYVDKTPSFYEGTPCGSVTSRGYSAEDLADRIRLLAAAPILARALQDISANAAESVEWIRRVCKRALDTALAQYKIGDHVRSIECGWHGRVIGIDWHNGAEMLRCQYEHPDGSLAGDDTRWFSPADVVPVPPDPYITMRSIRVRFANSAHDFGTTINGTRAEIYRYYDRFLNVASGDTEHFEHPIAIEFLDNDIFRMEYR